MALATTMQKGNIDEVDPDVHGRITKASVVLDGVTVTRVTFGPGARWSEDLRAYAGTESCELPHVALVVAGRLHVVMDDGSEEEFGANDVMLLPPGHDAWSVGDGRASSSSSRAATISTTSSPRTRRTRPREPQRARSAVLCSSMKAAEPRPGRCDSCASRSTATAGARGRR